jgi:hypothetical protein
MIDWASILYGAVLSAVIAATLVAWAAGQRRLAAALSAGLGAALGPIAWNAILLATHASTFFTDAPLRVLPASWQDAGSGVFAFAVTTLIVGLGPLGAWTARRAVGLAGLAGVSAFLVDVYLY